MKYPKLILIVILIIFISTNNLAYRQAGFIPIVFAEDGPSENLANQVINFKNESLPNKIIVSAGELFEKLKELGVTITNGVIKAVKSVVSELKTRVFRIALIKDKDNVVGSGIIPAHATDYRVNNSLIEANSKIFVSFTSNMGNKTWSISEKVPGSGFTIKLSDIAPEPLSFDYWIILVKEEGDDNNNLGDNNDVQKGILEDIEWKDFTDNLIAIQYEQEGKSIRELRDRKGIWKPETEKQFEKIYQYVYGNDMVMWQKLDGTEMCVQPDGKRENCVPHWKQEFENAKERGELQMDIIKGLRNGVRKNSVNGDVYNDVYSFGFKPVSKNKFSLKNLILGLIKKAMAYGTEFEDHFLLGVDILLADRTPDTTGTGYTSLLIRGASCNGITVEEDRDNIYPRTSGSTCGSNEGEIVSEDNTLSNASYKVSILSVSADTFNDTDTLCCRIQNLNNMYCVVFNETDSNLYIYEGGSPSTIDTAGGGIADGSTVQLICEGSSISVEDDNVSILSATNSTFSAAGKAGVGMGSTMLTTDDVDYQELDDFKVSVTASVSAAEELIQPIIIQGD